jgi:N-acetyl-gamma-glutamyl-phosphate reductase
MTEPYLIGLVGARGHTGRELIRLIAGHPELMLAYAVSREFAGRKVSEIAPEDKDECIFEALEPTEVARRRADAVILALPDGAGAPFVEAIEKAAPEKIIVDLSADHRFNDRWAYGLPELHREKIKGATRIANPGRWFRFSAARRRSSACRAIPARERRPRRATTPRGWRTI